MPVPLSIIMTVRNGERYLNQAILSLLGQTYGDFELIVVNDGSTDNSLELVKSFVDARLCVISFDEPIGRTPALNAAFISAQGDLVAVQDADDFSLSDRLQKQVSFLHGRPEITLVGTWAEYISEDGKFVDVYRTPAAHSDIIQASWQFNPFPHSTVMYRREPVVNMGGYPSDFIYAQDFALWLRIMRRYQTANIPEMLVKIRVHPDQMGQAQEHSVTRDKELFHLLGLAIRHPDLADTPGIPSSIKAGIIRAQSLSRQHRHPEALVVLGRSCLLNRHLWRSIRSYFRPFIRAALGPAGTHMAVRTIRSLERIRRAQDRTKLKPSSPYEV